MFIVGTYNKCSTSIINDCHGCVQFKTSFMTFWSLKVWWKTNTIIYYFIFFQFCPAAVKKFHWKGWTSSWRTNHHHIVASVSYKVQKVVRACSHLQKHVAARRTNVKLNCLLRLSNSSEKLNSLKLFALWDFCRTVDILLIRNLRGKLFN